MHNIIIKPPEAVLEVYVVNFKHFLGEGGHAPAPPKEKILYKIPEVHLVIPPTLFVYCFALPSLLNFSIFFITVYFLI